MPHAFHPREEEPEAEAAGHRTGGPPSKRTAAGVLDPPVPPRKPPGPIPPIPRSTLIKIFAIAILIAFAVGIIMYFWK